MADPAPILTSLLNLNSQDLEWDWVGRGGMGDGKQFVPLVIENHSCESTACKWEGDVLSS